MGGGDEMNQVGPQGAKYLADNLPKTVGLRVLGLSLNGIVPEGTMYLSKALMPGANQKLSKLFLAGNDLGDPGAGYIAEALAANCSLRVLHLMYNAIGPRGAQPLAEALKKNSMLRVLGLSGNFLG